MKKIIITGAPRTGSTALNTLLTYSPKILVMNEMAIFDYEPNHYYKCHREKINLKRNKNFLKLKGLTEKDIDDFFIGNFENKGNLEFFGDKFLTYCDMTIALPELPDDCHSNLVCLSLYLDLINFDMKETINDFYYNITNELINSYKTLYYHK